MKYKNPHPAVWRLNASHKKGVDFTWMEIRFFDIFFSFARISFWWKGCLKLASFYLCVETYSQTQLHMDIIILVLFTIFFSFIFVIWMKKRKVSKKKKIQKLSDFFLLLLSSDYIYSWSDCAIYFLVKWLHCLVVGFLETNFLTQFNDDVFLNIHIIQANLIFIALRNIPMHKLHLFKIIE